MRAAKQLGLWAEGEISLIEDDDAAAEMLADIALFEPNQRGRRAFDRFLARPVQQLSAPDIALAQRMAGAAFSLFRFAERHEVAGVWLEDLLDGNRRLWLMDEGFEASAPDGLVFGMRLFDAGPFHAGFGIIAPADEETVEFSVDGKARGSRLPFRHSLAATLYSDSLLDDLLPSPEQEQLLTTLLDLLAGHAEGPHGTAEPRRPPRRLTPSKR